jgi:hypothetical protein
LFVNGWRAEVKLSGGEGDTAQLRKCDEAPEFLDLHEREG